MKTTIPALLAAVTALYGGTAEAAFYGYETFYVERSTNDGFDDASISTTCEMWVDLETRKEWWEPFWTLTGDVKDQGTFCESDLTGADGVVHQLRIGDGANLTAVLDYVNHDYDTEVYDPTRLSDLIKGALLTDMGFEIDSVLDDGTMNQYIEFIRMHRANEVSIVINAFYNPWGAALQLVGNLIIDAFLDNFTRTLVSLELESEIGPSLASAAEHINNVFVELDGHLAIHGAALEWPGPEVTFYADATRTLHWDATPASSCEASGDWSGVKPTSGSEAVAASNPNNGYTLTCWYNGKSTVEQVDINEVSLGLWADHTDLLPGELAHLSWNAADASSCTASGAWWGSQSVVGSQDVPPGTYTLTCSNLFDSDQETIVIGDLGGEVGDCGPQDPWCEDI